MGSLANVVDYGHRLLVNVVDDVARVDPERAFAVTCDSGKKLSDPSVWHEASYEQVSRAVDYMAYAIARANASHQIASTSTHPFPTVAYLGPSDVRYTIFLLAAIKAGCQALFVSPRNTVEGQLNLFAKTNCHIAWAASIRRPKVLQWKAAQPDLAVADCPELDFLLHDDSVQLTGRAFPYTKTYNEAASDPAVVLHTSGTTGLPKPIVIRQGMWAILDLMQNPNPPLPDKMPCPRMGWLEWCSKAERQAAVMPPFHSAGLAGMVPVNIYFGVTPAYPPTDRPVDSDMVEAMLRYAGVQGAAMAPYILEEIVKSQSGLDVLKTMKTVMVGGGSLSKYAGDLLIRNGIHLANAISSTECLPYIMCPQDDPELWEYFVIDDRLMGCEWRPVTDSESGGAKDLYEMVLVRDRQHDAFQAIFWTFPELDEWSTCDIFERHPTRPNNWRYYGRSDDILVLSNGEKLNPLDIESGVLHHPAVTGSLVVGAGRFQAALLLEVSDESLATQTEQALLDDIWPVVEAANNETVAHGRIARPMMRILREKKLPRSAKGSIQRGMAIKMLKEEIDELYAANATEDGSADGVVALDISSPASLAQSICTVFVERLGVPPGLLEPDTDFFAAAGVDSLQVLNAARLLRPGLQAAVRKLKGDEKAEGPEIGLRDIYKHPTPAQLAGLLFSKINSDTTTADAAVQEDEAQEVREMKTLIDRFTEGFASSPYSWDAAVRRDRARARPYPRRQGQTVLVTGTTGGLGSYMLDALLHRCPDVGRVVALNREADGGRESQRQLLETKGLSTKGLESVEFLHADLDQPNLGLAGGADAYNALLADVDRIVHNAWPVHFHYSVSTFAPSLAGVRRLAEFAAAAAHQAPVLFVSSISAVNGWNTSRDGPVPEQALTDLRLAQMGYGRSKMVACLILDAAAESLGIPVVNVRLGQVGGPRSLTAVAGAAWNRDNMFPSIVASSVYLGALPDTLGPMDAVDWVAIEDTAHVLLDMVGVGAAEDGRAELRGSRYHHLVNPTAVPWRELACAIQKYYADDRNTTLDLVPFAEWVARLADSAQHTDNASLAANPAVKLLDQLRMSAVAAQYGVAAPKLALEQSMAQSPTLKAMGPVTGEMMVHWCEQWDFRGKAQ